MLSFSRGFFDLLVKRFEVLNLAMAKVIIAVTKWCFYQLIPRLSLRSGGKVAIVVKISRVLNMYLIVA